MKHLYSVILTICAFALAQAQGVTYTFEQPTGTWWTAPATPELSLKLNNTGNATKICNITLSITSDVPQKEVYNLAQSTAVPAGQTSNISFKFNLQPGFYNCKFTDGDSLIAQYNIGYEPERIISLCDYQPDFVEFWQRARADLDSVAPEFSMERFKEKDTKLSRAYIVKMKSVKGEEIMGFAMVPKKKGKYPAVINYMGYGAGPAYNDFLPIYDGEFIYYQQSIRGQGLTLDKNTHGQWMAEHIDDIENYYYRNAFMDAVRGIDFVFQMPEFDGKNLFAEGGSQGGALTMAATALDKRIVAAAPFIPFLSDFPDYLNLSEWIGGTMRNAAKEAKINEKQMLKNLSYFDMKNLCTLIDVPVLMAVGLQDNICHPHTNFSGYNNIHSPKSFVIYPAMGHGVERPDWDKRHVEFFKKHMK